MNRSPVNHDSRSVQFSYIKDPYRILDFSEAVGFAIGGPNLEFLSPAARQLM